VARAFWFDAVPECKKRDNILPRLEGTAMNPVGIGVVVFLLAFQGWLMWLILGPKKSRNCGCKPCEQRDTLPENGQHHEHHASDSTGPT